MAASKPSRKARLRVVTDSDNELSLEQKILRYQTIKAELPKLEREIRAEGAARLREEEGLLCRPRFERIIITYGPKP